MRGPSLVKLTGDDNSAISTVAVIRVYFHISSSCHIVRDEWWTAAAAADDSTSIGDKDKCQKGRRAIITTPFQKRLMSDSIR